MIVATVRFAQVCLAAVALLAFLAVQVVAGLIVLAWTLVDWRRR